MKRKSPKEWIKELSKPTESLSKATEDTFLAYGYYISSAIYNKKLAGEFAS